MTAPENLISWEIYCVVFKQPGMVQALLERWKEYDFFLD